MWLEMWAHTERIYGKVRVAILYIRENLSRCEEGRRLNCNGKSDGARGRAGVCMRYSLHGGQVISAPPSLYRDAHRQDKWAIRAAVDNTAKVVIFSFYAVKRIWQLTLSLSFIHSLFPFLKYTGVSLRGWRFLSFFPSHFFLLVVLFIIRFLCLTRLRFIFFILLYHHLPPLFCSLLSCFIFRFVFNITYTMRRTAMAH